MKSLSQHINEVFTPTGLPLTTPLIDKKKHTHLYRFSIFVSKRKNPDNSLRIQYVDHNDKWIDTMYDVKLVKVVATNELTINIEGHAVTLHYDNHALVKELNTRGILPKLPDNIL